jgi:hypothetical protein
MTQVSHLVRYVKPDGTLTQLGLELFAALLRDIGTGGTGGPITAADITDATAAGRDMLTAADAAAQTALLDVFTATLDGLAPASGGGTVNFLRADGTWAEPPGGGGGGGSGTFDLDDGSATVDGTFEFEEGGA